MIWIICFVLSILILFVAILYALTAYKRYKTGRTLTPFKVVFSGVFVAIFIGLIPIFSAMLESESWKALKIILFDVLQTIQVFTINVGADLILDNINNSTTSIDGVYSAYMTCLFFAAPILTFGFLISLFKNAIADIRYIVHFWGDVYVFSELNHSSMMLARSLKANHHKAVVVFTGVRAGDDEEENIIYEQAREIGAICFRKDINSIEFRRHLSSSPIVFFAISNYERDNIKQSLQLVDRYSERNSTRLYVFSSSIEGELLFSNLGKYSMKVRRVNEVRSLIYNFLYNSGEYIFNSAKITDGREKKITVIINGMGQYGREMLKALVWYCQMDGYSLAIHAFDKDELSEDRFSAMCPELMSEKFNGRTVEGESRHDIHIYSGIDVETKTYADIVTKIKDITFVFVCLGDDGMNIKHSTEMRMLCEQNGSNPIIKTIVNDDEEKKVMEGVTNYRGEEYKIDYIGDLKETFSEENIMNNTLEKQALERHLNWGKEDEFWRYEYNYKSSMAAAIHIKARIFCGIPGADKEEKDFSDTEREIIEKLEHRRWNAYMRSEGYIYSGSTDKASRNDIGKMHHDLVPFNFLSEEEKRKDSSVGTINADNGER